MSQKKQGFVYGALILMLSNIIVKIIGAVFKIPLANFIGDTAMGYFNSAYSIYTMFFLISTAGLPVAISRMIAAAKAKGSVKEVNSIYRVSLIIFAVIGVVGTLLLFSLSNVISKIPGEPELAVCIRTISPIMFFICVTSCIRGYFQGNQNMTPTAVSQIIEVSGNLLIGLTAGIFATKAGHSAPIVAAFVLGGVTLGVALSTLYLCFAKSIAKRDAELNLAQAQKDRSKKSIAKELIMIAIPITIASSVLSLTSVIDSMVAVRRLKDVGIGLDLPWFDFTSVSSSLSYIRSLAGSISANDSTAISIYGAYTSKAVTLFNLPPTIIYPFAISIIPAISAASARGDMQGLQKNMNFTFRIVSAICIPAAIGMCVMAKPIIELLFTANNVLYYDLQGVAVRSNDVAAPMLSILAIAIVFSGLISVSGAMLQAYGFERKSITSTCCGVLTKLVCAYTLIGIPSIGAYGIPISTTLCYLIMFLFNMYFLAKHADYRMSVRKVLLKPLIASLVCAGTALGSLYLLNLFLPSRLSVLCAILLAVFVYTIVLFAIRGIDKEDVLMLPKGERIYHLLRKVKLL